MPTYRVTGLTQENSVDAQNLVIAYKGDRDDAATMGQELGRATAASDGWFNIEFDDWDKDVFVLAMDPTDTVKYDAEIIDWLRPEPVFYDEHYDKVALLMRMEGVDGGTVFTDDISNRTITPAGVAKTTVEQVKFGSTSAFFNPGGDDAVTELAIDNSDGGLALGLEEWCVEFFLYSTSSSDYQYYVMNESDLPGEATTWQIYSWSGNLRFYIVSDISGVVSDSTAGTIPTGQWSHIAVCRQEGSIRAYINGKYTGYAAINSQASIADSSTVVTVGNRRGNSNRNTHGYIDNLRITVGTPRYTKEFAPILYDYPQDTDPYFYSVKMLLHMDGIHNGTVFNEVLGHTVTRVGSPITTTSTFKFGGSSAYFGNSGGLEVTHDASFDLLDKDFTVECWANLGSTGGSRTLLSTRDAGSGYCPIIIRMDGSEDVELYMSNPAGTAWVTCETADGIVTTTGWHHIAVCRNDDTVRIYIDGVQRASATYTGIVPSNSNAWHIGKDGSDTTRRWDGYIDDFRLSVGRSRYYGNFEVPVRAFKDQ